MIDFFKKINIENFKLAIFGVFKRAPLSVILSMFAFIIIVAMIRVEDMSQSLENSLLKAIFTLSLSFFFSVAMYLLAESKNIERLKKWLYQILTLIFGLLFYYFFEKNIFTNPETEMIVYIVLTSIGIISFIFIASFICKLRAKNLGQEEFYSATYNLLIKILMSVIVGIVTMLLGFIALSATFALFELDFANQSNWFGYWAAFSLSLFAPIFFLVNLPFVEEGGTLLKIQDNKFYSFLINYVGLPAIFIYLLILYSYTVKVLVNFSEWPQGEVAWLVILFSFFGYIIYFASFAFRENFKPASILRKYLPTAILLQTFMLFYAIGLRINQYDLTINRYLVLAFGIWLFGLSLYFIVSKKKSLATPFYSLLVVVIFISIGPWSVYVVPEWRQQNNLEDNLREANVLQENGEVVTLEKFSDISGELSGEIYGGIEYLCNYHGCDSLEKFFSKEIIEIKKKDREEFEENKKKDLERAEKSDVRNDEQIKYIKKREYSEIRNWTLITKLTEKLKVKKYFSDALGNKTPESFIFRNNNNFIQRNIDVSGYQYLIEISSEKFDKEMMVDDFENIVEENYLVDIYSVILNTRDKVLDLYLGDALLESFQIEEKVITPLLAKKDESLESRWGNEGGILLSSDDMTFELPGTSYDLKLVLREINIKNPEWKEKGRENDDRGEDNMKMEISMLRSSYTSGYVLIKIK